MCKLNIGTRILRIFILTWAEALLKLLPQFIEELQAGALPTMTSHFLHNMYMTTQGYEFRQRNIINTWISDNMHLVPQIGTNQSKTTCHSSRRAFNNRHPIF